jgi:hypothetical protein
MKAHEAVYIEPHTFLTSVLHSKITAQHSTAIADRTAVPLNSRLGELRRQFALQEKEDSQ